MTTRIGDAPTSGLSNTPLDLAKLRRMDWLADREAIHSLRLYYGTSNARWKILGAGDCLFGPHDRLYVARRYADAENAAFHALARDIYNARLLRAADYKVPHEDFETAAADWALSNAESLFCQLERSFDRRQVRLLKEEACEEALRRCLDSRTWPADNNGGVIAIIDAPGLLALDYSMCPAKPVWLPQQEDEAADVEILSPIEPLREVLLGTAVARFSRLKDPRGLDWLGGNFLAAAHIR